MIAKTLINNLNNKFFWMKTGVIGGKGFLKIMGIVNTAQALGIPIKLDPKVYIAEIVVSQAVPQIKELSNNLWNNEVKAQSRKLSDIKFTNFKNDWENVNYTTREQELQEYLAQIEIQTQRN